MTLQKTVQSLASSFAEQVVAALRTMSLEEILAATGRGAAPAKKGSAPAPVVRKPVKAAGGRLPRRSEEDIAALADQIIALLKKNKAGLRSEQIQKELGLDKKELPRPIAKALESKRMIKKGEKRATTYFAR